MSQDKYHYLEMMMKKQNEPKKPGAKIDIGTMLVIGAAAFQAYQFGRALNVYDPDGWAIRGVNIGGLILGVIVNVIVALAATKLPLMTAAAIKADDSKGDKKTRQRNERRAIKTATQARFAQVAFYVLLILSPFLVAPAWYILWSGLPLHPVMIGFLCVGWAMAPDLGIALGGFVEGKSLVHLSDAPASARGASARSASDSPKKSDAPATDSAKSASESGGLRRTYPRRCEHCASDSPNGLLRSANAVGGHMKKHHPELCKPKVLAEQLFRAEVKQ